MTESIEKLEKEIQDLKQGLRNVNQNFARNPDVDQSGLISYLLAQIEALENRFDEQKSRPVNPQRMVNIRKQLFEVRCEFDRAFEQQSRIAEELKREIGVLRKQLAERKKEQANFRGSLYEDREFRRERELNDMREQSRINRRHIEETDKRIRELDEERRRMEQEDNNSCLIS